MPQLFKAQMVDEVLHTMNHEQSQEQGGRALVHYAAPTVVHPIHFQLHCLFYGLRATGCSTGG